MNDNEREQNTRRNKYICPFPNCDLIPEILNIHSDSGIIVLKCSKLHFCELDIFEYFKILDEKSGINPKSSNIEILEKIDFFHFRNVLLEKKKDLMDNIKINNLILNAQEKFPYNYKYNKNVINISKYIEEEKSHSKEIDNIIKKEIEVNNINEDKAIEKLQTNYKVYLYKDHHIKKEELFLILKGGKNEINYPWLRNEGFKLISQIKFKNLIEINIANNRITDITPLYDMFLPHLKIINVSDNLIVNISPVADLLSKNLSEIYLQNNKIEELGPFLNSNFPYLKIFRVDNNEIAIRNNSFQAVRKKYVDILFYENKGWNYFTKKYNCDFGDDTHLSVQDFLSLEKLELNSKRVGDIILKDLFLLINYPNRIKYLILDDNKLKDVSILNTMPLNNLELLDLSLNIISNILFIKKLSKKCRKLKTLYLNDNKISNISPLVKIGENNKLELILDLNVLTLKSNCLDKNDVMTNKILDYLIFKEDLNLDYEKNDIDY